MTPNDNASTDIQPRPAMGVNDDPPHHHSHNGPPRGGGRRDASGANASGVGAGGICIVWECG